MQAQLVMVSVAFFALLGNVGALTVHDEPQTKMGSIPRKEGLVASPWQNFGFKKQEQDFIECNKDDGFGAQYHCQIAAFALARHRGVCYKYHPFHTPGFHNKGQNTAMDAAKFTGLKSDHCSFGKKQIIDNPMNFVDGRGSRKNPNLPETYYTPAVREELRQLYWSTPKPEVDEKCQVAMHVRRGDVHQGSRFTSNEVLREAVFRHFRNKTVCVYSEGKPGHFGSLAMNNVVFKLNGPTDQAFHGLVAAPEMIMAKSSFSYAAALINKGKVHYISRFWHKELTEWDLLDTGKSFARENLDALVEPPPEAEPSDFD